MNNEKSILFHYKPFDIKICIEAECSLIQRYEILVNSKENRQIIRLVG